MSLRRRFLNVLTFNPTNSVYSLRRIDLWRQDLFYPPSETPPKQRQRKMDFQGMGTIRMPPASVRFLPNPSVGSSPDSWRMDCFGLSENKIICTDKSGRAFLYDAALRSVVTMPSLHGPKRRPFSLSFPDQQGGDGSLYIMERIPRRRPEKGQFEAFVYAMPELYDVKAWYHHSLPLPPYVLDPGYKDTRIRSYAVLGGGSHLCISAEEGIGTYCFDTAKREWSRAGDWMLPFDGKAEYIPELNLWFGLMDKDYRPCAADLSSALDGGKPEVCGVWKNGYPPEWESLEIQIVSLGSGRFCILSAIETVLQDTYDYAGSPVPDESFAVLTGVELLACKDDGGSANPRGLRIINHKSKFLSSYHVLEAVL